MSSSGSGPRAGRSRQQPDAGRRDAPGGPAGPGPEPAGPGPGAPPAGEPEAGRAGTPARAPKLTGRAAVLAIVLCAIALSLAYPVREYISERRQIDQMQQQNASVQAKVQYLQQQQRALSSPARVEQEARDKLGMCMPGETCYEIIPPSASPRAAAAARPAAQPWYELLWKSVEKAGGTQPG